MLHIKHSIQKKGIHKHKKKTTKELIPNKANTKSCSDMFKTQNTWEFDVGQQRLEWFYPHSFSGYSSWLLF